MLGVIMPPPPPSRNEAEGVGGYNGITRPRVRLSVRLCVRDLSGHNCLPGR